MSASPRMGDTTWAPQRRLGPKRHPCKGERKVRPSCRNWSRSSVRLEPFVQYSYPHASLVLPWWHPLCARESSCLRARLPSWQDAAVERHAPGVSNADLYFFTSRYILEEAHPFSCLTFRRLISVATAVGRHLRANPPGDSSVDDVEAAFAAAIMRTAELIIPPQERRRPGRGWSGDARTEAELQAATDAMHTAWQRLRMDTRDAQLRRAVRKACNG